MRAQYAAQTQEICSYYSLLCIGCSLTPVQIIQEKQKYRKTPRNYAMTKSRIIREKVSYVSTVLCSR